jgi:hypothetical protein
LPKEQYKESNDHISNESEHFGKGKVSTLITINLQNFSIPNASFIEKSAVEEHKFYIDVLP